MVDDLHCVYINANVHEYHCKPIFVLNVCIRNFVVVNCVALFYTCSLFCGAFNSELTDEHQFQILIIADTVNHNLCKIEKDLVLQTLSNKLTHPVELGVVGGELKLTPDAIGFHLPEVDVLIIADDSLLKIADLALHLLAKSALHLT